ncbi:response regulator [Methylomonas rosea]|uniref:histidine kinase n=1 Tax=Methylomonas rosea TaxID=2952227 RepID=A0ABT1TR02_9GAMM|nr:response regulator [Methylomonas sp. WSC-7]MCQ8117189.1 response regulator [Methylomonas sp. WSC-7]
MDNSNSSNWLQSAGEMGKLVAAKDWAQTPLGPIESWSQSLRTTVSLCLSSNFPIAIAWGAERTQIYNDGYWPICGAKHPHAMGQDFKECWLSAWPVIGPAFESAATGQTAFLTNQRLFIDRNGYLEETFFTFSFSPIHDETGAVGGLFHPVVELTQQSLIERRLEVLRELAYQTQSVRSVADTLQQLLQTLASHNLDVPFALCYRLDDKSGDAELIGNVGFDQDTTQTQALSNIRSPASWPLAEALRTGQNLEVDGLTNRFGSLICAPYPEPPNSAVVLPMPAIGPDCQRYLLVAGVSARRALDEPYRNFYAMLGSAVSSLLVKAQADEDERRRIEALAELDRAKIAFFSNVSHEFRTPITLMLGPLEDLLADYANANISLPISAYDQLKLVHRNGFRLLKLVNTLLDFASIEANRMEAVYEATELGKFTADLASLFRSAIEKAGLRLIVSTPELPEPVYVDRRMWEKIVINLLSNALKFTFTGEIEVSVRACESHVELAVRDTGVGIAEDQQARIFERFHRIQNSRSRTHEGTGIGLALVQELTRMQGGDVSVQSQSGVGSIFTVTVPRGTRHLQAENIREPQPSGSGEVRLFINEVESWLPGADSEPTIPGGLTEQDPASVGSNPLARIVLADDNLDMLQYVSRVLQKQGYQVSTFRDGEAALAAIQQQCPDMLLTDIMMPRLDGLGLVAALRKSPKTSSLPIILLSARAGEEARADGLKSGADEYLVKPFSARELLTSVQSRLEIARLRQAAEAHTLLQEVEREFHAFAESMPQMVWATRPDGWTIYFNQKWVAYTGLSLEESYGHGWVIPFHPDDQPRAWAAWQRATQQLDNYSLECRLRRADGVYRWWLIRGVPLLNEHGEIYKWIGTCTDIHDLKENEENLRVSEARWQFALVGSDQGVWDWDIQNDSVFFSKRWKTMLGYADEEISNRFEEWSSRLDPDDLKAAMTAVDQHFRGESAYYQQEYRMRNRHNDMLWIQARGMVVSRDADGRPLRMIGTHLDVTAQHKMLADTKLWANAFKYCAHGIVISNPATNQIIFGNPAFARLEGYDSPDEVAGLPVLALYTPDKHEQIKKYVNLADKEGQVSFESRHHTKSGVDLDVQVDIVSVKEANSLLYRVATVQDISLRKQNEVELIRYRDQLEELVENRTQELFAARQEAERLSQVKGTFIANMSHEIRTPMNAVLGFCYLLEKRALDEESHQLVRKIHNAGETLLGIINDILDFSKIEAGHLDIEQAPFDLLDMLDSVADLTAPLLKGKHLELIINPPQPQFTTLIGDATRLRQVLLNLLSNAIKFTQHGEVELRISVEAQQEQHVRLRFSVRDTGIGISESAQNEIFSAFTQADTSITRRFGGTGLGLPISRQLVGLMGGTLRIKSQVGFGSEFWFTLPLARHFQTNNVSLPALQDLHVLVSDDSDPARDALVNIANCLGWTVESTDSGCAALLRLEACWDAHRRYDVVLLDWKMPGLDGFATARAIRQTLQARGCQTQDMPVVILVTAYSRDELFSDPGMAFIDTVLNKPVTASALYNAVSMQLSQRIQPSNLKPVQSELPYLKRIPGVRVLVVDDSEINREVAKDILEADGAVVFLATDGQEALDWLAAKDHVVDMILMDVQMPRLDGYAATRLIRQNTDWQRLPIIALTAGAFNELADAAREAGMDDYVSKPFNVDHLLNVISRFTQRDTHETDTSAATPSVSQATEPADSNDSPLALPGIDLAYILNQWQDKKVYQKYFGKFVETYATVGDTIFEYIDKGYWVAAAELAHKLIGVSASLGLTQLALKAREVNDLLTHADASAAIASQELQAAVIEACNSITILNLVDDEFSEAVPNHKVVNDPAEMHRILGKLLETLELHDLELAERLVRELALILTSPELEQIRAHLDNFDFNAAITLTKALLAQVYAS